MKVLTTALLVVLATASVAAAQPALATCKPRDPAATPASPGTRTQTYQEMWCVRVLEIDDARRGPSGTGGRLGERRVAIENAVEVLTGNWKAFLLYSLARSGAVDASAVEDARTDKQVGAPAGAGSTSLVSKGAVPGILGFAVENGALTQTTSDTTITLRGNLVGWLDLLRNQEFIAAYQDGSGFVRGLRRVSYSLTMNTDTGAVATPAASGAPALTPEAMRDQLRKTRNQLAGYSVRVAIFDRRDPRTAANRAAIATLADTQGVELLKADDAFRAFLASPEYSEKWLPATVDLLADPTRRLVIADIQRILYQRLEVLRLLMISRIDGFDDQVARNLLAFQAYDKARLRLFDTIRKQPLFAFEYVNARPANLPEVSTLRFIYETQWGSRVDVTANGAVAIQHSGSESLTGSTDRGGVRDVQVAGQMDVPLGSPQKRLGAGVGVGPPVLAIAFLSQRLTDRGSATFGGSTFTVEPGWINAVQAKVTVSVKGSGLKIPLSLSYSNRTELLKEKDVRGHIGVTFDMDVLTSLVRR